MLALICVVDGSVELGLNGGESALTVGEGSTFTVKLETNPSTGYNWSLVGQLPECITEVSRDFKPRGKSSALVGATMTLELMYKVVGPCQTDLTYKYTRPWEKDPGSSRIVRIHLSAESNEYL